MPILGGYCYNFWKKDTERLNQSFIETEIKTFKSFDLVAYCSKNPETRLLPTNVPNTATVYECAWVYCHIALLVQCLKNMDFS